MTFDKSRDANPVYNFCFSVIGLDTFDEVLSFVTSFSFVINRRFYQWDLQFCI